MSCKNKSTNKWMFDVLNVNINKKRIIDQNHLVGERQKNRKEDNINFIYHWKLISIVIL